MTIEEAILARHSVRQYKETPLSEEQVATLTAAMDKVNAQRGLHLQLIIGEPKLSPASLPVTSTSPAL